MIMYMFDGTRRHNRITRISELMSAELPRLYCSLSFALHQASRCITSFMEAHQKSSCTQVKYNFGSWKSNFTLHGKRVWIFHLVKKNNAAQQHYQRDSRAVSVLTINKQEENCAYEGSIASTLL